MRNRSTARATTRSGKKNASKSAKRASKKNTAAAKRSPKPKQPSSSGDAVARAEALVRGNSHLRSITPRARFKWALRALKLYPEDYDANMIHAVFVSVGFDPARVGTIIQSVLEANRRKSATIGEV